MHIYIYKTYIHILIHKYKNTITQKDINPNIDTFIKNIHTYIFTYRHIHINIYIHALIQTKIYIHTYIHTHTYIYIQKELAQSDLRVLSMAKNCNFLG